MKTFELQTSFGHFTLKAVERQTPILGPREVLLRMRAILLNYQDLSVIIGYYNPNQPLPLILLLAVYIRSIVFQSRERSS